MGFQAHNALRSYHRIMRCALRQLKPIADFERSLPPIARKSKGDGTFHHIDDFVIRVRVRAVNIAWRV